MNNYYPVSITNTGTLLPADEAQQLVKKANAHYRALAEYDQTVQPVLLRLQNVNWELVRELIMSQWQHVEADCRRAFFYRQNGANYLAARGVEHASPRYAKRPGAYPSRFIYLPHEFYPVQGWCPWALDKTRRVPARTFAPRPRLAARLAAEEQEGYEYLAARRPVNPDVRAQVAVDLLRVARLLSHNHVLGILLETGAPRLRQLSSGAGHALGYVAYFTACWQQFHAIEQAAARPALIQPAEADDWPAYFKKLLKKLKKAKHLHDVAPKLREAFTAQQRRGLYALEDFMERLPTYVLAELSTEMKASLETGLMRQLYTELHRFRQSPEAWPVWHVAQRGRLVERRQDFTERLAGAEAGGRADAHTKALAWHLAHRGEDAAATVAQQQQQKLAADLVEYRAVLARLDSILAALDAAQAAGREQVRASELVGLSTPEAAELPAPELAAPPAAPNLTAGAFAPALSPADRILVGSFTLAEADRLATAVGLLDDAGRYCLGPRKLGAVVGFAVALQQGGKLTGAIPDLTAVLAPRWGVEIATRKTATGVAQHYFSLTSRMLARPKTID